MADQVRHRSVTVPAGTLSTAPLQTDISFPPAGIERIEIFIPAGHAGLTGIALAHAHQPILPFDIGQFIIADDEVIKWDLDDMPNSGNWQTFTYNTDVHDHTFYLRFLLQVVVRATVVVGGPTPFVAPATTEAGVGGGITVIPGPSEGPIIEPTPEPEPEPIPEPTPEPEPEPEPEPTPEPEPEPEPEELLPEIPEEPLPEIPEELPEPPPPPPPPAPIAGQQPVIVTSGPQPRGYYTEWGLFFIRPDGERVSQIWRHYKTGPEGDHWAIAQGFSWGKNPAAKPPVPPWEVDTDQMVEGRHFDYLRWRHNQGDHPYY